MTSSTHTTPKSLPNLAAIVAVCDDWGIGLNGDMVVSNPADMRHFVAHTTGHTVLMGRRTLESFPGGRPLKRRRNIVLTRDASFVREGVEIAATLADALALVADDETWVVGGGQVYREALPYCSRAVVTRNHCVRPADTFFPNLDDDPAWRVVERVAADENGNPLLTAEGVPFEFVTYERTINEHV